MRKTVLITGCSSGFGKLAAKKFQQEGWNVVATMRSPEKETELTELENVWVVRLDVMDKNNVENVVDLAVAKFGRIDVLVNNAGYGGHGLVEQFEEKKIFQMFNTNVFGPIRTSKAVLPYMRKQGQGVIINITSAAGITGIPITSTYAASKFALEGLTESMDLEYAPFGIRVRSIAPGAYGTNFNSATDNSLDKGDEEVVKYAQTLAGHFLELAENMRNLGGEESDPQEVADMIYDCAISDMPVHNYAGADAKMLLDLRNSLSHQDFIEKMREMLMPNELNSLQN